MVILSTGLLFSEHECVFSVVAPNGIKTRTIIQRAARQSGCTPVWENPKCLMMTKYTLHGNKTKFLYWKWKIERRNYHLDVGSYELFWMQSILDTDENPTCDCFKSKKKTL